MNKHLFVLLTAISVLTILFGAAFTPSHQTIEPPIYADDFEYYLTNSQLSTAYTVWQDGALMRLSLEKGYRNSGGKGMRIDLVGPNPNTHATSASLFHLLQPGENDWSNAAGIRFWIYNLSKNPLSFTINFKEQHNEFWAVADNGVFYLNTLEGDFLQQDIQYGNLPIPAFYHGFVYIPFESFAVPSWNTAKGDFVMDLSAIDSFSLGANVTVNELQRFSVDNIEVLSQSAVLPAKLNGSNLIDIPNSGQHREQYQATLYSTSGDSTSQVENDWSIVDANITPASIEKDGWLTIPSDIEAGRITLMHTYHREDLKINTLLPINIVDPSVLIDPQEGLLVSEEIKNIEKENSAYQQFANRFENWASENRAWFVIIAIAGIVLLIISLSFIQNRLK